VRSTKRQLNTQGVAYLKDFLSFRQMYLVAAIAAAAATAQEDCTTNAPTNNCTYWLTMMIITFIIFA